MSALGQKQTYAAHKLMSALPPIATAKADFPQKSCLLYPQERTCAVHQPMSALGPKADMCTEQPMSQRANSGPSAKAVMCGLTSPWTSVGAAPTTSLFS